MGLGHLRTWPLGWIATPRGITQPLRTLGKNPISKELICNQFLIGTAVIGTGARFLRLECSQVACLEPVCSSSSVCMLGAVIPPAPSAAMKARRLSNHPSSFWASLYASKDRRMTRPMTQCKRGTNVRGVIKQFRGPVYVYVVKQASESYAQMFVKEAMVRRQLTN